MPGKAGVWENAEFLSELTLALYQVANTGGALSTQAKSAVEAYLKSQGHDQSWESVRTPVIMGRSQMKWDAAAHEYMLICVVKHCDLNSHNMQKVLEDMQKRGYEFTENAFRPFSIMSEKPVRGWNANSHEALLFAMIEEFKPNKEKVIAIVQRMNNMGYAYTFHAVNQHIQKLRKARDTSALDGSAEGSKPATPRKATPRKTPASGRKRKVDIDGDADELGLDIKGEGDDTPTKRIKNEPSSDGQD